MSRIQNEIIVTGNVYKYDKEENALYVQFASYQIAKVLGAPEVPVGKYVHVTGEELTVQSYVIHTRRNGKQILRVLSIRPESIQIWGSII